MRSFSKTLKAISLVTIFCFVSTQISWGAPAQGISVSTLQPQSLAGRAEVSALNAASLAIPTELGQVTDTVMGDPLAPTFIHIQSAHGNYHAEKNIEKLLGYIEKNSSVKLLLLEGAGNKLQPELFRLFPKHPDFNKKFTDKLMQEGYLTGPESFLIESAEKIEGWGIEDLDAYKKDRDAFISVVKKEKTAEKFLGSLRAALDRRFLSKLNKDLLNLVRQEEALGAGTVSFESWIKALGEGSRKHLKTDLSDAFYQDSYPFLIRYFRLQAIGSRIDREKARREADAFLVELDRRKVSKEILDAFKTLLQAPETDMLKTVSRTTDGYSTMRRAFDLVFNKLSKDFSMAPWPNWMRYAQYIILMQEMEGKGLQEETVRLKEKLLTVLARTTDEKEYLLKSRELYLLRRLFSLELTRAEYEELRASGTSQVGRSLSSEVEKVKPIYEQAIQFYAVAVARENKMFANALKRMNLEKKDRAVIVTGGFHADGLKNLAVSRHCSYLQITPRINEVSKRDHDIYLKAMMGSRDFATSQAVPLLGVNPIGDRIAVTGQDQTRAWRSEIRGLISGMIHSENTSLRPSLSKSVATSAFGSPRPASTSSVARAEARRTDKEEINPRRRSVIAAKLMLAAVMGMIPLRGKAIDEISRIPALVRICNDESEPVSVRYSAQNALGAVRDPAAVPELINALSGSKSFFYAQEALREIPDRSVTIALKSAFYSQEWPMFYRAFECLVDRGESSEINDSSAIPRLRAIFRRGFGYDSEAAAKALYRISKMHYFFAVYGGRVLGISAFVGIFVLPVVLGARRQSARGLRSFPGAYRGGDRDYAYDRAEWESHNSFIPLSLLAVAGNDPLSLFIKDHQTAVLIFALAGMITCFLYAVNSLRRPQPTRFEVGAEALRSLRALMRDEDPSVCARAVEQLAAYAKAGSLKSFRALIGVFYDDAYKTGLAREPISAGTKALIVSALAEFDSPAVEQLLNDAVTYRSQEISKQAAESLEAIKSRKSLRSESRSTDSGQARLTRNDSKVKSDERIWRSDLRSGVSFSDFVFRCMMVYVAICLYGGGASVVYEAYREFSPVSAFLRTPFLTLFVILPPGVLFFFVVMGLYRVGRGFYSYLWKLIDPISWSIQRLPSAEARNQLLKAGSPAVPKLMQLLETGDVRRCLESVGLLRDLNARAELEKVLDHADGDVRAAAVAALRNSISLSTLATMLEDPSLEVRAKVVALLRERNALIQLGNSIASPHADVRNAAITAKGDLGDTESVPLLMEFLKVKETRGAAVVALEKIGDPRSDAVVNEYRDMLAREEVAARIATETEHFVSEATPSSEPDDTDYDMDGRGEHLPYSRAFIPFPLLLASADQNGSAQGMNLLQNVGQHPLILAAALVFALYGFYYMAYLLKLSAELGRKRKTGIDGVLTRRPKHMNVLQDRHVRRLREKRGITNPAIPDLYKSHSQEASNFMTVFLTGVSAAVYYAAHGSLPAGPSLVGYLALTLVNFRILTRFLINQLLDPRDVRPFEGIFYPYQWSNKESKAPARSESRSTDSAQPLLTPEQEKLFQKALSDLQPKWWDGRFNNYGRDRKSLAKKSLRELKEHFASALDAALKDQRWDFRYFVAIALGEQKDPRAIPVLSEVLHGGLGNRSLAVHLLSQMTDEASLEALLEAIKTTRNDALAIDLVKAMGVRGAVAVPMLIEALGIRRFGSNFNKAVAAQLGVIGDLRAVPALMDELYKYAGRAAAEALRKMGDPRSEVALKDFAEYEKRIAREEMERAEREEADRLEREVGRSSGPAYRGGDRDHAYDEADWNERYPSFIPLPFLASLAGEGDAAGMVSSLGHVWTEHSLLLIAGFFVSSCVMGGIVGWMKIRANERARQALERKEKAARERQIELERTVVEKQRQHEAEMRRLNPVLDLIMTKAPNIPFDEAVKLVGQAKALADSIGSFDVVFHPEQVSRRMVPEQIAVTEDHSYAINGNSNDVVEDVRIVGYEDGPNLVPKSIPIPAFWTVEEPKDAGSSRAIQPAVGSAAAMELNRHGVEPWEEDVWQAIQEEQQKGSTATAGDLVPEGVSTSAVMLYDHMAFPDREMPLPTKDWDPSRDVIVVLGNPIPNYAEYVFEALKELNYAGRVFVVGKGKGEIPEWKRISDELIKLDVGGKYGLADVMVVDEKDPSMHTGMNIATVAGILYGKGTQPWKEADLGKAPVEIEKMPKHMILIQAPQGLRGSKRIFQHQWSGSKEPQGLGIAEPQFFTYALPSEIAKVHALLQKGDVSAPSDVLRFNTATEPSAFRGILQDVTRQATNLHDYSQPAKDVLSLKSGDLNGAVSAAKTQVDQYLQRSESRSTDSGQARLSPDIQEKAIEIAGLIAKRDALPEAADLLVVFGGPDSARVAAEAAKVFAERKVSRIIVSGRFGKHIEPAAGDPDRGVNKQTGEAVRAEALIMRDALISGDVPPEAIWVEKASQGMTDNGVFSVDILKQKISEGFQCRSVIFMHGPLLQLRGTLALREAMAKAGVSAKVYDLAASLPLDPAKDMEGILWQASRLTSENVPLIGGAEFTRVRELTRDLLASDEVELLIGRAKRDQIKKMYDDASRSESRLTPANKDGAEKRSLSQTLAGVSKLIFGISVGLLAVGAVLRAVVWAFNNHPVAFGVVVVLVILSLVEAATSPSPAGKSDEKDDEWVRVDSYSSSEYGKWVRKSELTDDSEGQDGSDESHSELRSNLTPEQEKQFQKAMSDLQPKWWDGWFYGRGVERMAAAAKILGAMKDFRAILALIGAASAGGYVVSEAAITALHNSGFIALDYELRGVIRGRINAINPMGTLVEIFNAISRFDIIPQLEEILKIVPSKLTNGVSEPNPAHEVLVSVIARLKIAKTSYDERQEKIRQEAVAEEVRRKAAEAEMRRQNPVLDLVMTKAPTIPLSTALDLVSPAKAMLGTASDFSVVYHPSKVVGQKMVERTERQSVLHVGSGQSNINDNAYWYESEDVIVNVPQDVFSNPSWTIEPPKDASVKVKAATTPRSESRLTPEQEKQFQKAMSDLQPKWWDGRFNNNGFNRHLAAVQAITAAVKALCRLPNELAVSSLVEVLNGWPKDLLGIGSDSVAEALKNFSDPLAATALNDYRLSMQIRDLEGKLLFTPEQIVLDFDNEAVGYPLDPSPVFETKYQYGPNPEYAALREKIAALQALKSTGGARQRSEARLTPEQEKQFQKAMADLQPKWFDWLFVKNAWTRKITAVKTLARLGWVPKTQGENIAYLIAREDWDALAKIGDENAVEALLKAARFGVSYKAVTQLQKLFAIPETNGIADGIVDRIRKKDNRIRYEDAGRELSLEASRIELLYGDFSVVYHTRSVIVGQHDATRWEQVEDDNRASSGWRWAEVSETVDEYSKEPYWTIKPKGVLKSAKELLSKAKAETSRRSEEKGSDESGAASQPESGFRRSEIRTYKTPVIPQVSVGDTSSLGAKIGTAIRVAANTVSPLLSSTPAYASEVAPELFAGTRYFQQVSTVPSVFAQKWPVFGKIISSFATASTERMVVDQRQGAPDAASVLPLVTFALYNPKVAVVLALIAEASEVATFEKELAALSQMGALPQNFAVRAFANENEFVGAFASFYNSAAPLGQSVALITDREDSVVTRKIGSRRHLLSVVGARNPLKQTASTLLAADKLLNDAIWSMGYHFVSVEKLGGLESLMAELANFVATQSRVAASA